MSLLLVDISNSFVKFAAADSGGLHGEVGRLPTAGLLAGRAAGLLAAAARRRVVVASVVPRASRRLEELLGGHAAELGFLSAANVRGLAIDYPEPESIGADRLANGLGALALVGGPCVVVDFGTAVTFDIIDRRGCYVGGVIAPGVAAMTEYLHEKTALLPRIELSEPVGGYIGKSTRQAMLVGAVHGYRGLIHALLEGLRGELGRERPLHVLATGGHAELISAQLPEIGRVEPHLTLLGLLRHALPAAARD